MYILTRKNRVIDYCESGYLYVGNIVVCNDKNCNFEDATIVEVEGELPQDIDGATYDYINGQFVRVFESTKISPDKSYIANYLAFLGANTNMITAAFGKNNEDKIKGIGKALAMYGTFKDEKNPIDFMKTYDKYSDLVKDHKVDLINTPTVWDLINGNSYAKNLIKETNVGLPDVVVYDKGNSDYLDLNNITTHFTQADPTYQRNSCSINIENGNIRMKLNVAYTNDGSQWAGFSFPVINALPSLKGYRYLHVKLADSPASYLNMGSASNTETVNMHLTINGKQRLIFTNCNNGYYDDPGYGLSYKTGKTYTEDAFDLNLTDSVMSTMQFNLSVITGIKQEYASTWADMSVEKIWFSET